MKTNPPRRSILKGGAAGSLLLVLPVGCDNSVSPPTGPVPGGNVSATSVGSLELLAGEVVILGRDAGGLYAMSASCTHQGCLVSVVSATTPQSVSCPCHGSRFDVNGAVTQGPAGRPLPHYQVDVATDGTITIHGDIPVSADVRTAVT
jgi:Rieske Fe-S protein